MEQHFGKLEIKWNDEKTIVSTEFLKLEEYYGSSNIAEMHGEFILTEHYFKLHFSYFIFMKKLSSFDPLC